MNCSEHDQIRLTVPEVSFLWMTYSIESMVHHILSYYSKHVEDKEIDTMLVEWVHMTRDSLNLLKELFSKEGISLPRGITAMILDQTRLVCFRINSIFYILGA